MVMVWREIVSHVEGMVGRACRVWMTVQIFAPSAAMLCESSGKFGEQQHDNISVTHYLWSGAGVWTMWTYKWLTCAPKHVCSAVLVLILPLFPSELRKSLKSMDTWLSKASVIMRPIIWLSRWTCKSLDFTSGPYKWQGPDIYCHSTLKISITDITPFSIHEQFSIAM